MAKDHSWDASAAEYVSVYEKAITLRRMGNRTASV
jgi:glycogen synthase